MTINKFIGLLILSTVLVTAWLLTYIQAGYPLHPLAYITTAPRWHVGLQITWLVAVWLTAAYGIRLAWRHLSKQTQTAQ